MSADNNRRLRNGVPIYRHNLGRAEYDLHNMVEPLGRTIDDINSIGQSQFFYSGRPDNYLRFLVAAKAYHEAMIVGEKIEGQTAMIKEGRKRDLYATRIRGVTIPDIEQLPLPLDLSSLSTISRFIRHGFLSRLSVEQRGMQNAILMLPIQAFARGDFESRRQDRKLPSTIEPLAQRMIGYMDFFTPFLMDQAVDPDERAQVMRSFPWVGSFLVGAIGSYVPARFGITPSSAMKAFEIIVGDNPSSGLRRAYLETLRRNSAGAFRADILPKELHPYTQYDPNVDKEAVKQLVAAYGPKVDVPPHDLDEVIANFSKSEGNIRKDVLADNRQKSFVTTLGGQEVDTVVTTQYRRSLTFILKFTDKQPTHLTLDFAEGGQIYGLPYEMVSAYPVIGEHLTRDLLDAATRESKKGFPDHPARVRSLSSESALLSPGRDALKLPDSMLLPSGIEEDKPVKRKRRAETLESYLTPLRPSQPALPEAQPKREKLYRVAYSKTRIRELAGKKVPDQMVDRLAAALRQFERGQKRVKSLGEYPQYDSNDLGIRVGDFRMVIKHVGGGRFDLIQVDDRRDAY